MPTTTKEELPQDNTNIPTPPKNDEFTAVHLLISVVVCTLLVGGITYLQITKIINPRNTIGLFAAPIIAGMSLAITNRKHISGVAFIALPIVFAVALMFAFGGVMVATELQLEREANWTPINILIENAPFFVASYLIYKSYSFLADANSIPVFFFHIVMSVGVSFLFFKEILTFEYLQPLFFACNATLLSILHIKK